MDNPYFIPICVAVLFTIVGFVYGRLWEMMRDHEKPEPVPPSAYNLVPWEIRSMQVRK